MTSYKYETSRKSVAVTALNILDGMNHQENWEILQPAWDAQGMGFDGFCGWITDIAEESERLLVERPPQNWPGVYDYEVSCEMGAFITAHVMVNGKLPEPEVWKPKLVELADGFFAQGAAI